MNFNFYELYKDYSNIDLLKIVKRPDDYQRSAVDAAKKILSERQVFDYEIQEVDDYFRDLNDKEKAKVEKINAYKNKATDFLEPLLNPGTAVKPEKWLKIFLLVISLQYLWFFYNSIKELILYIQCDDCTFDITVLFTLINLPYIIILFYLLLKRKMWGWILLFANNVFSLITTISQSHIFFKYQKFHGGDTGSFISSIIIYAAFTFFLWRKDISEFFGVSEKSKKQTAIAATVISLLFVGVMELL